VFWVFPGVSSQFWRGQTNLSGRPQGGVLKMTAPSQRTPFRQSSSALTLGCLPMSELLSVSLRHTSYGGNPFCDPPGPLQPHRSACPPRAISVTNRTGDAGQPWPRPTPTGTCLTECQEYKRSSYCIRTGTGLPVAMHPILPQHPPQNSRGNRSKVFSKSIKHMEMGWIKKASCSLARVKSWSTVPGHNPHCSS